MNRKIIFITMVLILLCGLNAVSANDIQDADSSIISYSQNTNDKLSDSADSSNFTKLSDEISSADANSEIELKTDYVLNSDESSTFRTGIAVNNNITIDGKGHTINASGLGRIFNIGNSSNVLLKNLILTGGYVANGHGGAVYLVSGNLTVENVTFTDNNVSYNIERGSANGGAVYVADNANLAVKNSLFEKNTIVTLTEPRRSALASTHSGGAIFCGNSVTLNVVNSTFKDNNVTSNNFRWRNMYAGAISSNGANSLNTISNSTFINNSASTGMGALWIRIANVTGSIFQDNYGNDNYPTIYYEANGRGTVSYNVFLDSTTQIRARNNIANVIEQYNWWASNEPGNLVRMENTYKTPNSYIMLDVYNEGKTVKAGFIKDSNREDIPDINSLPVREVTFEGDVDNLKTAIVNGITTVNYNSDISEAGEINVTVDGYTVSYTLKEGNILTSDVAYVEDTSVGENGTVILLFTGDNGPVDGTAKVSINNNEYTVNIRNGIGLLEAGDNYAAGSYDISYEYLGSSKYVASIGKIKSDTKFNVVPANVTITYTNEYNDIYVNVSHSNIPTGSVNVTVGNVTETLTLSNGIANYNFGLDIAESGDYDLKIVYLGDKNHNAKTFEDTFEITKSPVNVTFTGVPDEIKHTHREYYSDFYFNIICDGIMITTGSAEVYEGENMIDAYIDYEEWNDEWLADLMFYSLSAGEHEMTLVYNGDGYYTPYNTTFKVIVVPTVSIATAVSDDSITFTISSSAADATGKYTLTSNDEVIANGTFADGKDTVVVDKFQPGNYNIKVIYEGNDVYLGNNATTSIFVPRTSQYPNLGNDASNTGMVNATRGDTVSTIWNATLNGALKSSPIIDSYGNIYLSDGTKIYSFTSNGTLRWSGGPGAQGIAIYNDELIFAPQFHNAMMILNATTGQSIGGNYFSASSNFAPILGPDGRIYAVTDYGYPADGNGWSGNYWVAVFNEGPYDWEPFLVNQFLVEVTGVTYGDLSFKASPTFSRNGYIYANTVKGFKIVEISSGKTVFSDTNINTVGRAVLDENNIAFILDSNINGIYALSPGTILWNVTVTDGIGTTLAVDNENDILYAVNSKGVLYKYSTEDGSESKVYDIGANATSILIDASGNIYVSASNGNVLAVSPEGELIWTVNLGSSLSGQMAMNNEGTIYAVADNTLFALGSKTDLSLNTSVNYDNGKVTIEATLNDTANGTVIFIIDNNITSDPVAINGNVATWETALDAGNHTIIANFTGNAYYASVSAATEINITELDIEFMNVPENVSVIYGNSYAFYFNILSDGSNITTGTIAGYNGDNKLSGIWRYSNGQWRGTVRGLDAGSYEIRIEYVNNGYYKSANTTFTITVLPQITVTPSLNDENIIIDVSLSSDDATGKFTVLANNNTIANGTISEGKGSVSVPKLNPDTYEIKVVYEGDDKYQANNGTSALYIPRTSQYPNLGNDASNTGMVNATREDSVSTLWTAVLNGNLRSSPVIDSYGNIYLSDGTKIYSFTSNGTLRWSGGPGAQGIAIYNDELIFAPQHHNAMMILNATTGQSIGGNYWSASSNFAPIFGPDGRIYAVTDYGYPADGNGWSGNYWVAVFNEGYSEWEPFLVNQFLVEVTGVTYGDLSFKASPTFSRNGYIYANTVKGFKIVEIATGTTVFSDTNINAVGRAVLDENNIAFILDSNINGIYALSPGTVIWNVTVTDGIGTTLAVDNENSILYAVNSKGVLYKYSTEDGSESKVYDIGANALSILIDASGNIYVSTDNGNVLAISPEGELIWTVNLGSSLSGQLAMNKDGIIYAFADKTLFALGFQADLNIKTENVTVFDDSKIIITTTEDVEGNLTVIVNGVENEVSIINSTATLDLGKLPAGTYDVTVIYAGNDKYGISSSNSTFTVNKVTPEITSSVNNTEVTLTFAGDVTGNVLLSIDGINYYTEIKDGKAVFNIYNLKAGNTYTASVNYLGNDKYYNASAQLSVNIPEEQVDEKIDPELKVTVSDTTLNISINSKATGNVLVDVGSAGYYALIKDGKATVNIIGLNAGTYNATVKYLGDDNYLAKSTTASVTVTKTEPKTPAMTVNVVNTTLEVTLPDDATGHVIVDVGNAGYYALIKDGKAVITVPGLASGNTYTAIVTYLGNSIYNTTTKTASISIPKDAELITPAMTVDISDENITVNLPANATGFVLVNVEGNGYYAPVTNGKSAIKVQDLSAGNHTAEITYTGDKNYKSVNKTELMHIERALGTIISEDLVKIEKNASRYEAQFTDIKGNTLANKTVKFIINGNTYTRTTDNTGKAGLNINLVAGTYSVIINNTVTGEVKVNTITVQSRFTDNPDLEKYYKNASRFVVRALDDQGNPVKAGESVRFNINGVFYNRTTNATGHASIAINLQPGEYIVTSEYRNCVASNKIIVKPVLSAEDLTKQFGVRKAFTAKLVDGTGKALADTQVTFNINGVLYSRTTNAEGIASLNINLQAGEYIITTSYNGSNIANKVTVTA